MYIKVLALFQNSFLFVPIFFPGDRNSLVHEYLKRSNLALCVRERNIDGAVSGGEGSSQSATTRKVNFFSLLFLFIKRIDN